MHLFKTVQLFLPVLVCWYFAERWPRTRSGRLHVYSSTCIIMSSSLFFILFIFLVHEIIAQGVRVIGRTGFGRVEVLHNGHWGTVCEDNWDNNDAQVVCRELGFHGPATALPGASVDDGSGKIWLDEVRCLGTETSLSTCSHAGWGYHDCSHSQDAGVRCSGIRINGTSIRPGIGRVEVLYNGVWGTVCDDRWGLPDARVVCRELGYKGVVNALSGRSVEDGSGQIWLDEVACGGDEDTLFSCAKSSWGVSDCVHAEDAGVECDINECTLNIHNCHSNSSCTNTNGSFICTCDTGYTGNGTSCQDIDECTLNVDNCHPNSFCTNTNGSFICTCNTGYTGNGTYCRDINECQVNRTYCDPNSFCINTNGSFVCTCNIGYTKNGTSCQDINECALNVDNCVPNAFCTNTN